MNPLFEGIAANDSKDLVNFIIMTLHKELNKANNINKLSNNDIELDQTNRTLIFNNFSNEFISNNKSVISDLFYSMNCNVTECFNCHIKLFNFQIYFFIIFPLEEVRKYKIQNMNNNQYNLYNNCFNNNIFNNNYFNNNFLANNNEVNLFDCFEYDRKLTVMCGDNTMYCRNCQRNTDCGMHTFLVTGPEILVLILNRGQGIEFDVKISFVEYLNLSNYIEYTNTGFNYKLIGVITHIGESSMGGHFISYCRDPITDLWYKYNDAIVNQVNNI